VVNFIFNFVLSYLVIYGMIGKKYYSATVYIQRNRLQPWVIWIAGNPSLVLARPATSLVRTIFQCTYFLISTRVTSDWWLVPGAVYACTKMHRVHMKMPILRFTLREKSHFSLYQKRSMTPKYAKNAHDAPPDPRLPHTPAPSRLRRSLLVCLCSL